HKVFGTNIETLPCDTFREVARKVTNGESDYGVMAIENSIAGSIIANYGILQDEDVQVSGEVYLPIVQNLMVLPGVTLDQITEVESHPMALLQCVDYLDSHPSWKLVESEDTALSAKRLAEEGNPHKAAIASTLAAELFGLEIIQPEINTIKKNYTRFMVLKRRDNKMAPDANKASLYFKADNRPGALIAALQTFSDVNMTKLQSYPVPSEPWHYMFHVDLEFDNLDLYFENLARLQAATSEVHVYGVYHNGLN
ncbi:MAG: prephenate dehydratase, partial [Rikenellaceae bacterium]|nr:prephenate dehydratase [Rikenellaceae bacterium]